MSYERKKLINILCILVIFSGLLLLLGRGMTVSAETSNRVNERKYFTSHVVEPGDTLWDICDIYMTEEYSDRAEYIDEVKESNRLESDHIYEGQLLIVPYYADKPF